MNKVFFGCKFNLFNVSLNICLLGLLNFIFLEIMIVLKYLFKFVLNILVFCFWVELFVIILIL